MDTSDSEFVSLNVVTGITDLHGFAFIVGLAEEFCALSVEDLVLVGSKEECFKAELSEFAVTP